MHVICSCAPRCKHSCLPSCTGLIAIVFVFRLLRESKLLSVGSDFCAGAGQLHVFCPQAPELLDRLLASVRLQRLLSSPLPSPPPLHRGARRLSRSESDLYCVTGKDNNALGGPWQHHNFLRHKAVLERSHSSSRTSATSDDYVQAIGGKVTMVLDLWWSAGSTVPKAVSGPRKEIFAGPTAQRAP